MAIAGFIAESLYAWHDPVWCSSKWHGNYASSKKASSHNTSKISSRTGGRAETSPACLQSDVACLEHERWLYMGSQPCFAVILPQRNEGVEFRQVFMSNAILCSAALLAFGEWEISSWLCVCVSLGVWVFLWELKTSSGCSAPYLPDRCNHRQTTARPPKQIKMVWSGVCLIYLFIPQPHSKCNHRKLPAGVELVPFSP